MLIYKNKHRKENNEELILNNFHFYFLDTVHVHDLSSPKIQEINQLTKTRGANVFALDIHRTQSLTGEKNTVVRLCVAVKRKLQLYYWKEKKRQFEDFSKEELTVPDIPREIAW